MSNHMFYIESECKQIVFLLLCFSILSRMCSIQKMLSKRFALYIIYISFTKLKFYKSLIESHFRYAIGIWGSTATTHMNILRNLQERCIKILMGRQLVANVAANKYSISGILTPKGLYTYTKIINH